MQQNQLRRPGEARTSAACPYCRRTFRRTEHLTRHVRIHTKEKPFICQCGAAFARRDLLTRHERATHNGQSPSMLNQESPKATSALEPADQNGQHESPNRNPTGAFAHSNHQSSNLNALASLSYQAVDLSPEFVHNETELNTYDQFREFGNFLDGLGGLSTEWISYFHGRDLTNNAPDPQFAQIWQVPQHPANVTAAGPSSETTSSVDDRLETPVGSWLPAAPRQARIVEDFGEEEASSAAPATGRISDEQHAQLALNLEVFRGVIGPSFRLPSQHALTRYVTSCFEGFIRNLPFIHHTWRVVETAMELLLAICAVGARYCFEHRTSMQLYMAAKAILVARLQRERDKFAPGTADSLQLDSSVLDNAAMQERVRAVCSLSLDWGAWEPNDSVPTLILLTGYAAWEQKVSLVQECLKLHRLLAQILRDLGLQEEEEQAPASTQKGKYTTLSWREWIRRESNRRAKLSAFAFIHTASIAYDVYPILRASEISLRLPCTTREWNALTGAQWHAARQAVSKEQLYLQEAMSLLLTTDRDVIILDPWPTPLGNYILLHGLIQRIYLVRDLLLPTTSQTSLPKEEAERMERALHSWASGFQLAPESSLDQQTDHGPIPFTCSAMLALAYIRITQNFGPYRHLDSLEPGKISKALNRCPPVSRHDGIISAVLYATHALSIPVRLGVERVAKSQFFFWTVRHSLSGLECAVILSQWLSSLASTMEAKPLTDAEFHILQWVRRIVSEAYMFVDFDDGDFEFREDPAFLSVGVVKVWAHFFKKNAQWPFIHILGESLDQYRALLEVPRE